MCLRSSAGGGASQTNYLFGNFELLVFIAQPFKLESQHAPSGRSNLASDNPTEARHEHVADRTA